MDERIAAQLQTSPMPISDYLQFVVTDRSPTVATEASAVVQTRRNVAEEVSAVVRTQLEVQTEEFPILILSLTSPISMDLVTQCSSWK